ncbi:YcfA-like protein [Anaerobiospirillum thomasii]|uniref:YcfA-like protein n=1 Tax=Anaerobiospirillum thomasii TaxID=179995 RepID=A0A2X0VXT1_9GAMM|nr:type II toxin-antitoxin system HicA family toxin [Anaerobiospirillum thomasii]SPT70086.1 YcfA-like protein [Anaerobiospirillum thomasii]SPT72440.1 YcfA-like protein [Anaerobiospirillum thomasii]
MKTAELKRLIVANGATFKCQGTNHEKWINKSGEIFTVPRHRNIKDNLARAIIKQSKA